MRYRISLLLLLAGGLTGVLTSTGVAKEQAQKRYLSAVAPNPPALTIMRRSLLILAVTLLAGVAAFFTGERLAAHWCLEHAVRPTDDLEWLRLEFGLTDADLARVRQLHEGYLPRCHAFCAAFHARLSFRV